MQNVEWGEFKIGDLFEVNSYKKRFDANKVEVFKVGKYPYVVRMSSNNGQKGFINEDVKFLNEGNTISFGQDTATMYYQDKPYFTGDKIKVLKPKEIRFNKNNAQFFISTMKKAFSTFSWGSSSFNVNIIKNQKVSLPITKDKKVDFNFIESSLVELESSQINKLGAYLIENELNDYQLTAKEKQALEDFSKQEFKDFNVIDVFDIKNTGNILSRDIIPNSGTTPYLCASAENNGVSSFITYDEKYIDKGNCVFIGGKTFVVSYQEKDFFSNDSHNLVLYSKDDKYRTKLAQLYLATCVNKSLGYKYSWGDSISSTKIKKDKIALPIKDNKPDYETMKTIILAIQKLVIKNVVLYVKQKREKIKG